VWQQIGGSLTGDPTLIAAGGQLRAFALDGRGALQENVFAGAAGGAWTDRGGLPACCATIHLGFAADDANSPGPGATGRFSGCGRRQILLAFEAPGFFVNKGRLELRLYDITDGFTPTLLASSTQDTLYSNEFGLAVGDFNGDGRDEFAVLSHSYSGAQ